MHYALAVTPHGQWLGEEVSFDLKGLLGEGGIDKFKGDINQMLKERGLDPLPEPLTSTGCASSSSS